MLANMSLGARQIFYGNILMVVCCVFYLAWWLLAFRPVDPIKGVQSGWLLIPAALAGVAAMVLIIWGITAAGGAGGITASGGAGGITAAGDAGGITAAGSKQALLPNYAFIIGGIVLYIILAIVTVVVFKRQMTSELLLFVLWSALALAQTNTLYGSRLFSGALAVALAVLILAVLAVSLVCYVLFYRLGGQAAFIDGMIPLALVGLAMAAMAVCMVVCTVR
ncbi:MAG: hypothetical protein FWF30_04630 [Coriobacteriia bacterium]|nr:hypothetical protein [Coriobacteriia bacterium]